ncbi:iron chaperone [Cellulomonas wangsupingiae]|uniref:DUF1801 domain-containing protein n=1 Tax=Cellulomonas wangsupingiae TaxID=2968085 RepID=A0ABY5K7X9_9CELL|nr:DUF1801 domain-containing protein [Cellulomonas wangsupingiae]MCC2334579.1 DUF1801 domain-containing protein [Cellulomonas wangsupingiae]UUI66455.1 DUF1801 domain-containing protein [Cellulomonas wangsupingiae]
MSSSTQATSDPGTFTAEERTAMKERAAELRAESRRGSAAAKAAEAEAQVLAKIAELPAADRVIAERVHAIVREVAPDLTPRTWYGMPAYAKDGKVVCFLKPAGKFESRYATLGFEDPAALDDGPMWPTSYALTAMNEEVERALADLVRRAAA